ncbi:hypothetical protein VO64_5199 [Pseudomonas synxantha]|uniref:Uncharacterized protein n=1 Tax=Pseudomonas synxantha TaxID=47883 RepID=A0AAU8TUY4_9PSED|nr:hypothetical protein VO64_5199 [Pseudomonas synxantha]
MAHGGTSLFLFLVWSRNIDGPMGIRRMARRKIRQPFFGCTRRI